MTPIQELHQMMTMPVPMKTAQPAAGHQAAPHTAAAYGANAVRDKVSLGGEPEKTNLSSGDRVTTSYSLLKQLVVRLLNDQGVNTSLAGGTKPLDIQDLTPGEARDLISENGYLGVKQTSDRIVQFAIASAGNDPAKLAAIKAGVEKGFAMAEDAFGGALPEISYKTYDAVMEKLDKWAAGFENITPQLAA